MRAKLGSICMAVGFVLIVAALGLLIWNRQQDTHAGQSAFEVAEKLQAAVNDGEKITVKTLPQESQQEICEVTVAAVDNRDYIDYVSLPILEQPLPVLLNYNETDLHLAPCRQQGTIEGKDIIIAAHNYSKHFGLMGRMKPGDNVLFTDMTGRETWYTVTAVNTVDPLWENIADENSHLTLYTCTKSGAQHIVVHCVTVSD